MELDTELHRRLGRRLSLHKFYPDPVAIFAEAVDFEYGHSQIVLAHPSTFSRHHRVT